MKYLKYLVVNENKENIHVSVYNNSDFTKLIIQDPRIIVNEIFKFAKQKGFTIKASCYSYVGKMKLKSLLNEYSKKYNVEFTDTDENLDADWHYTKDLVHKYELTDDELKDLDK